MQESRSELLRFSFAGLPLRGVLVRLTGAWTEILRRHASRPSAIACPAPVQNLLGEMTVAALLLHLNANYQGSLTLQISGDGPLKLAVAEVQPDLGLRATANVPGEVAADASLVSLVDAHKHGTCVVTLNPGAQFPGQQPWQGVVSLVDGKNERFEALSDVIQHYLSQDGQFGATLVLAANGVVAAGLLIQRLPSPDSGVLAAGEVSQASGLASDLDEDCSRIAILGSSLRPQELLTLDGEAILHRLFWQEKLLRSDPAAEEHAPHFSCTCSRARVVKMILGLGPEAAQDLVAERGSIEVGCDYCGASYEFDAVAAAQLFRPADGLPPATAADGSTA